MDDRKNKKTKIDTTGRIADPLPSNRVMDEKSQNELLVGFHNILRKELISFSTVVNNSFKKLDQKMSHLEANVSRLVERRSRKSTFCWFHKKFGIASQNCKPPCSFSSNFAQNLRLNSKKTSNEVLDPNTASSNILASPISGPDSNQRLLPTTTDDLFGSYSPSPSHEKYSGHDYTEGNSSQVLLNYVDPNTGRNSTLMSPNSVPGSNKRSSPTTVDDLFGSPSPPHQKYSRHDNSECSDSEQEYYSE